MLDWKYRPKTDGERAAEAAEQAKKEKEKEEKPEGFASKNAKIITFTVMLVLFLAFFGPISVFTIYRQVTDIEENQGAELTVAEVTELAKLGDSLTMAHLRQYRGTESESELRRTYIIQFSGYILNSVQDKETGALSVCLLTHADSGDSIDIRYEDVDAFLATH